MLLRLINKARFQDFLANAATLAIMIAIALGTLMPAPQLPEVPGNDKAIHLLAFVLLTLPLSLRPLPHRLSRSLSRIWIRPWMIPLKHTFPYTGKLEERKTASPKVTTQSDPRWR